MQFMNFHKFKWLVVFLFISQSLYGGSPDWLKEARQRKFSGDDAGIAGIVLHHETNLQILKNGEFEVIVRSARKILSPKGTGDRVYIIQFREGDEIDKLQAFQIDCTGHTKTLDPKNFVRSSVLKEADFSDERQILIGFDEPAVGDILAVEYRRRFTPFFYNFNFLFQYAATPFLFSKLSVELPGDWQLEHLIPVKTELVTMNRSGKVTSWTATNLPGIDEDYLVPPLHQIVPEIQLRFFINQRNQKMFSSWPEFGNFVNKLWQGKSKPDSNIARKVLEIADGGLDLPTRVKNICKFIQQKIRYISIQVEWGRYTPIEATRTFRNLYGDCKAKTALTISMLKETGIQAFPALVMTRDEGSVYPEFIGPRFNHVIVAIPLTESLKPVFKHSTAVADSFLIFDPTAPTIPPGKLPWSIQDTWALVVQPERSRFVKLPQSPADSLTDEISVQAKLTANGELDVNYRLSCGGYRGVVSQAYWNALEVNQVQSKLQKYFLSDFHETTIHDYVFSESETADSTFNLMIDFTVKNFARKIQDLLAFNPNVMNAMSGRIFRAKTRDIPVYFGQPGAIIDTVVIALPPAYEIDELPEPVDLKIDGIEYSMHCWSHQDTLWYTRYARRDLVCSGVADYEKLRKFYESRYLADQQQVILKFNPQLDAAFLELKQQVAQNHNSKEANSRLADYYLKNNMYTEAIPRYLNLLQTTEETGMVQYNLGVCYYHLRDYSEARKWAKAAQNDGFQKAGNLLSKIARQMSVR